MSVKFYCKSSSSFQTIGSLTDYKYEDQKSHIVGNPRVPETQYDAEATELENRNLGLGLIVISDSGHYYDVESLSSLLYLLAESSIPPLTVFV